MGYIGGMDNVRPYALSAGGESWVGWIFARYGRATDWRLIGPDGTHYTAAEIGALRALQLDVDYLRLRVRQLEGAAAGVGLSSVDAATVSAAAAVLEKLARQFIQPRTVSTAS